MHKPNSPDSAVRVFLFVVTWNSITLHQHREKTHTLPAISSCICSLPAAHSVPSLSLNQMKASELQVTADRSLASAWESHNLTSSLLNLPLCTAYNDSSRNTVTGAVCLLLMYQKKRESAKSSDTNIQRLCSLREREKEGERQLPVKLPEILPAILRAVWLTYEAWLGKDRSLSFPKVARRLASRFNTIM